MPKRFWTHVVLAAAVVDRAGPGPRIVEAQVVTAAADRLRIRRRLERLALGLGQLALCVEYREPAPVVILQPAARDRRDDEDQPPIAADEILDAVHAFILPHHRKQQQSRRRR